MKFIVEMVLKPGSTYRAMDAFELRGPNRNPGVALRGAWVGIRSELVFALVESEDEALVREASRAWADVGEYKINPVVEIEQF
ncbi:MAG TPA: DUF3303 family protein [Pirellulales bacterium]|jgi:hypothetical protein